MRKNFKRAFRIAVLTSGGVDSSVALRLLKEQGHDVTAFYLKIWFEDELSYLGNCPWEEDLGYLRKLCEQINVPLEIVPMQKEYFETIVKYSLKEVKAGRTPNPDMLCNSRIKFGMSLKKIDMKKFDKIATGHYAQIAEKKGVYFLKKAPDPVKDQTYFLSYLSQKQLSKLTFPIGHLNKKQVRKLAEKYDLPNKNRPDSQGICFLGKFSYNDFLAHYLGTKKGEMIEYETGKKVGGHEGYWFYTIGQRKGIKMPDGPWYVVKKNIRKNIVYISRNYYSSEKKRRIVPVKNINWFFAQAPRKRNLSVKLRHGERFYNCKLKLLPRKKAVVELNRNDQGIAAGQFAAFYDGEICLGSGIIY
ncbi:tRNA 2-thiouridine(34) synthase MnmA [Candidatus Peregrinibacteria bacterium]|nr:tRNA 2-thiouridine(34) synthase MnmA [Candidatus Peregrinibacteria bacterium]